VGAQPGGRAGVTAPLAHLHRQQAQEGGVLALGSRREAGALMMPE